MLEDGELNIELQFKFVTALLRTRNRSGQPQFEIKSAARIIFVFFLWANFKIKASLGIGIHDGINCFILKLTLGGMFHGSLRMTVVMACLTRLTHC